MKRKGFTLIELLVVIAILSVLLGVLMPSLMKAKTLAKISVCLQQIKSLTWAHTLYTMDNKDFFCRGSFRLASGGTSTVYQYNTSGYAGKIPAPNWGFEPETDRPLFRYVPPRVTVCPLDVGELYTYPQSVAYYDGTSYVWPAVVDKSNLDKCWVNSGIYALEGKKTDQIKYTQKKMFYADDIVLWDRQMGIAQNYPNWHGPEYPSSVSMGYVDGHAKATRVLDFGWKGAAAETPYGPWYGDWLVNPSIVESIASKQRYY